MASSSTRRFSAPWRSPRFKGVPECDEVNESSLHWDMVKDLRVPGGNFSVGEVDIIRDGAPVMA